MATKEDVYLNDVIEELKEKGEVDINGLKVKVYEETPAAEIETKSAVWKDPPIVRRGFSFVLEDDE
jgi:hypothetical protein